MICGALEANPSTIAMGGRRLDTAIRRGAWPNLFAEDSLSRRSTSDDILVHCGGGDGNCVAETPTLR